MPIMMMREQAPIIENANWCCGSTVSSAHRHPLRYNRYHTTTLQTHDSLSSILLCLMILLSQNGSLAWSSTCPWAKTKTVGHKSTQMTSRAVMFRPPPMNAQKMTKTIVHQLDHYHHLQHATKSGTSTQLLLLQDSFFDDGNDFSTPLIVVLALTLGVAANGWINQLMTGKEQSLSSGLGNFLKDGSGYNKSGFQLSDNDRALSQGDPLPWLKLPQLDFVSVAGQDEEEAINSKIASQLEALRIQMNQALDAGNVDQAERLREELEYRMQKSGMEFQSDGGSNRSG